MPWLVFFGFSASEICNCNTTIGLFAEFQHSLVQASPKPGLSNGRLSFLEFRKPVIKCNSYRYRNRSNGYHLAAPANAYNGTPSPNRSHDPTLLHSSLISPPSIPSNIPHPSPTSPTTLAGRPPTTLPLATTIPVGTTAPSSTLTRSLIIAIFLTTAPLPTCTWSPMLAASITQPSPMNT